MVHFIFHASFMQQSKFCVFAVKFVLLAFQIKNNYDRGRKGNDTAYLALTSLLKFITNLNKYKTQVIIGNINSILILKITLILSISIKLLLSLLFQSINDLCT